MNKLGWAFAASVVVMMVAVIWLIGSKDPAVRPPPVSGTEVTVESKSSGFTVYRTRVPGGWLYVTDHFHGLTSAFVPDPRNP